MGTWNTKPFGNDTASDWLWELEKATDESVLKTALGAEADGDETIAAAAVIEAARRQPIGKLPPKAKAWVSERGFVPSDALVKAAIDAVEKIKTQSELRELWAESNSLNSWLQQMDSLLAGLREVQSLPSPVRLPKAPSTPRRLEKIIEKVNPDEESPLRKTLRKKLEAITDLEASVTGTAFPLQPLTLLAKQGLLPEAKRLVERGAKVNPVLKDQLSPTPLEAACGSGQAEMAKWLLEQGAIIYVERTQHVPVNKTYSKLELKTFAGPTALYGAVRSGSIATIRVLMQHRARLDTEDLHKEYRKHRLGYDTFLHKAMESTHPHVIEFLVKNGMDVEVRDSLGRTALIAASDQATHKDRMKVIEKLLALGANPNAKDDHGFTALDSVIDSKPEVAELLKKYGGRLSKELRD
jgi:hypothetical protein